MTVHVRPSILVWPPEAALVETAEAALWAALDFEASAEEDAAAVVVAFWLVALQALEELEAVGVTRDRAPLVETH